jgi:transposase
MSNENENKGVYEHDVYVRLVEGNIRDSQELAELVITNSVNQEEYVFSVWGDGDDFDSEKVREEGLDSLVWLSGVDENITLDVDREELETDLNNALFQSSLDDFLLDKAMQDVTEKIIDYQNDDKEFIYKVPFDQLNIDMRTVVN